MASKTIDGQSVVAEARATALVFFASWCGHCRQELGELGILRTRYPELRIIGINAYENYRNYSDRERLRAYIAESAPWLTEIVHADEAMLGTFGEIPRIPTLFLYGKRGDVIAEFRRDRRPAPTHAELDAAIARAIERE